MLRDVTNGRFVRLADYDNQANRSEQDVPDNLSAEHQKHLWSTTHVCQDHHDLEAGCSRTEGPPHDGSGGEGGCHAPLLPLLPVLLQQVNRSDRKGPSPREGPFFVGVSTIAHALRSRSISERAFASHAAVIDDGA